MIFLTTPFSALLFVCMLVRVRVCVCVSVVFFWKMFLKVFTFKREGTKSGNE